MQWDNALTLNWNVSGLNPIEHLSRPWDPAPLQGSDCRIEQDNAQWLTPVALSVMAQSWPGGQPKVSLKDNVPTAIFKNNIYNFASIFHEHINRCITSSQFSDDLKIASWVKKMQTTKYTAYCLKTSWNEPIGKFFW